MQVFGLKGLAHFEGGRGPRGRSCAKPSHPGTVAAVTEWLR